MRPVLEPSLLPLEDARAFAALSKAIRCSTRRATIVVARAPGRLDVMGGIADYSGSLVLQWPLREATLVAAQATTDGRLEIRSLAAHSGGARARLSASIPICIPTEQPPTYEAARRWFAERPETRWAAYVLGVLIVLARETCVAVNDRLAAF